MYRSGREFHNFAAKYEKECNPWVVVFEQGKGNMHTSLCRMVNTERTGVIQ